MKRVLFSRNGLIKTESFATVARTVAFPDQLHAIMGFRRGRPIVFGNPITEEQVIAFFSFKAFKTDISEVGENGALGAGDICPVQLFLSVTFCRHFGSDSGITFIVVDPWHP